jgi:hypothetical protein
MEILYSYSISALSDAQNATPYGSDVLVAIAAAASLLAILAVVYLVIRATYLILRLFVGAAGYLTAAVIFTVIAIGLMNR